MSPQCLPLHHNAGVSKLHLLVHGLHAPAQLQVHDAAVLKVSHVGCWLLPDALHSVHLVQALILWSHVVQTCNQVSHM